MGLALFTQALRQRLGLSAAAMGTLLGVTAQSIYKWEDGKARPRASQLQAIAAARKLGKREAAACRTGTDGGRGGRRGVKFPSGRKPDRST